MPCQEALTAALSERVCHQQSTVIDCAVRNAINSAKILRNVIKLKLLTRVYEKKAEENFTH